MVKETFKRKTSLFIILITLCTFLIGCKKEVVEKGVFVANWNNYYEGNNIRFYYEDYKNTNLQQLKNNYNLNDVIKDSQDDFQKALKLMSWVHSKMKYNKGSISTKEDALSILKEAENKNTLSDKDFAIVYSQCAASLGIYARRGEFRVKNSQQDGKDSYYKVCEIWSDKYNKWIMLDVVNNCYMEVGGKPLSAVEILNAGLQNVNTMGIKDIEKYIKKIKPYFYSYTIEIDNNIYGVPKSNSFITYSNSKDLPEIRIEGNLIRPTIFVKNDNLFNKCPRIDYKNDYSDKIPTLIFSKKKTDEKENGKDIVLNGAAFKDSGMLKGYYISIDGKPWIEVNRFFTFTLNEGNNNIRLSQDKKKVIREVTIEHRK